MSLTEQLSGYYYDELSVGMSAVFGKTVTEADIMAFAGVSGDTNPVHLNAEYAAETVFKSRIAHGVLTASFISTVIGTKLPGPGCIYVSQNLRFKAPVMIGDTVMATVKITALVPEKRFVEMSTVCTVGDKVVLEGEATVMAPKRRSAQ
ncbi:(R)-hydratase [Alphaproteobacteria bacterium HT1-32]|nr:(R)-hydratase [Alphaproteobacteria bacterium HT1-32]|tara:strand:+ start:23453 stop:23899 length:447 start_codon:yes stop_codon:yes gene_type:complete